MRSLTTHEFITRATVIHNGKYDYSNVVYKNAKSKVEIICKEHGKFLQEAFSHLDGKGCQKCWQARSAIIFAKPGKTLEQFVKEADLVHSYQYDYSNVVYCYTKIKIRCYFHGIFEQIPNAHLQGSGCKQCHVERQTTSRDDFILHAKIIHNGRFIYDKIVFVDTKTKVEIVCPQHGSFFQQPTSHLSGCGCPKCSTRVSKLETKWLDSLNILGLERQKIIKIDADTIVVDGFDAKTNTVYEFYGDYWHGNPKIYCSDDLNLVSNISFGELFQKTIQRQQKIIDAHYDIIYIWESDFL